MKWKLLVRGSGILSTVFLDPLCTLYTCGVVECVWGGKARGRERKWRGESWEEVDTGFGIRDQGLEKERGKKRWGLELVAI